jgi:alkylation response protein AidB-like acyl-CoA dehydrogenase
MYTAEAEAYREKVQAFLAEKLPTNWKGMGTLEGQALTDFVTDWRRVLFEADYLAPGWPREYGGAGLSALEQVIIGEEFAKAGVPTGGPNDVFGIQMLGNTMLQWGTEEQKRHYLPRILSGEDVWCQGYSEPNAGQRPVEPRPEGTARRRPVDPQRPEDLDLGRPPRRPHLHPRPHRPRCPASQGHLVPAGRHAPARRRGAPDQDDLGRERVQRGVLHRCRHAEGRGRRRDQQRLGRRDDAARLRAGRGRRHAADPLPGRARPPLGCSRRSGVWPTTRGSASDSPSATPRSQIMRFSGMRVLTRFLPAHHPGPDGAISKLYWSEYHKEITELAIDILGAEAMVPSGRRPSSAFQADDAGAPNSSWSWVGTFLNARAGTIYAGSSQIQRNIIGEMVLGLPKEPR